MRLLMTTDTVGGVWTFTNELAGELLARGCDIALVSFGPSLSAEQEQWVTNLTVSFPNFIFCASDAPLEWMPQNASAYSGGEPLLLDMCRNFQPSALLLSQFCFGALPVGVPKIVVAHSDVLSWAAAVGKAPLAEGDWLRNYRSLVQRGLDAADVVIAPTRAMLHDLCTSFAVPGQAQIIANGRALPWPQSATSRKLQAVSAGRMWDEAKNLKLLKEVQSPIPILIAGDSDHSDPGNSNVLTLGRQGEAELLGLFRESAIYICSSVYEPFGLAPLEAALCGCAVIANDIPSLREVWGNGAIYFHDAASLSHLLNALAESPAELATAQASSHARARLYTSARAAENYIQVIESTSVTIRMDRPGAFERAQLQLCRQTSLLVLLFLFEVFAFGEHFKQEQSGYSAIGTAQAVPFRKPPLTDGSVRTTPVHATLEGEAHAA